MSRSARQVGVGAVCLALALSGCGGRSPDAPSADAGSGDPTTGITADEVLVGNVSALSGPIPGLFQGAPDGVAAYLAKVNSEGGVQGRQVTLVSKDDALNCNQNTTATTELAGQVAALIANYSVFDGCGAAVLADQPDLANVSPGVDPTVEELSTNFSPSPSPSGYRTGGFDYYRDTYGVGTVGTVYGEGSAEAAWTEQLAAMESVGYQLGYARGITATETDFTADIVRMREAGVDHLYLNAVPVSVVVKVLQQAQQQNWKPKVISSGLVYDARFFDLLGDPAAAEGVLFDQPYPLFLGEDRASVPAVDDFLTWMEKTHPETQPDLFAMLGWTSAQLFVQALDAAGENPSRQDIVDALGEIGEFDADGMLPGTNVSAAEPPECWMLGQVVDGGYTRVMPEEGFSCDYTGYFRTDGS